MTKWAKLGILALAFGLMAQVAMAADARKIDWVLTNSDSRLNFISIKKGNVAEVHHFDKLKGTVDEDGKVNVTIDLTSVQTWVDIRNERLKEFLFETVKFPVATIDVTLDRSQFEKLQPGQKMSTSTEVTLTLHGVSQKIQSGLEVYRLTKNRVLVLPSEPILLDTTAYGMGAGVDKLKELAKLDSISTAVPVTFSFVFDHR
jgi:polyisoprenoid-binding protein YceI